MKDFTQKLLPGALSTIILLSACSIPNNFTKNNYTVTPNPLEMKGDSVMVTINGTVPPKSINAKAVIEFQPYFKTSNGTEIPLKKVSVKGNKATASADYTIDSKLGGNLTYTDKIAYTDAMKRGQLYPRFSYQGKEVPVAATHMVEGTIATAKMLKWDDKVIMSNDDYKAVGSTKSVNIYFPIDNARFNPNFTLGKDINNKNQLTLLKMTLKSDSNWVARGISLNSYASPDGELKRNADLAQNRANSSNAYFKKELKKLGFSEVNDENFTFGFTSAEDWAGFAKLVSESNLSDKNEMLNIINNTSISEEEREGLLKRNHTKSWEKCATTILPKLRRSELIVSGATPLKTDAQLLALSNNLSVLNQNELRHLYALTADNAKKLEVLTAYTTKFANDWVGYNNLAAHQIKAGKLTEAETSLNTASNLNASNGSITANKAALKRAQGDWMAAEKLYKQAANQGAEVSYNLGLIAIKRGNYAEAVSNFNKSGVKDFNSALASLLNGDANTAKTQIDNMSTDNLTWDLYYLRAVAGARLNNQDVVTTNIARAVGLNADVRNLAKDDVEFLKFFSNPLFEAAIR